jgi:hypothetical protein
MLQFMVIAYEAAVPAQGDAEPEGLSEETAKRHILKFRAKKHAGE